MRRANTPLYTSVAHRSKNIRTLRHMGRGKTPIPPTNPTVAYVIQP